MCMCLDESCVCMCACACERGVVSIGHFEREGVCV